MKKYMLSIFALLVCYAMIQAQCPTDNIVLSSQTQIDSFSIHYPGCTELSGGLKVEGVNSSSITSLTGLNQITSVSGDLHIHDNDNLPTLTGLENLTTIGGDMNITNNLLLDSLTGLENLISIGGDMNITNNLSLDSLTGLENLTTIGGDMTISQNPIYDSAGGGLKNLTGLENLTSLGGNLTISQNAGMFNLRGLENLTSISGNLTISHNYSMVNLTGLENLISVGGGVTVSRNSHYHDPNYPGDGAFGISSLKGLETLTTIGGNLSIIDNFTLDSFNSLYNLTTIGGNLQIMRNYEDNWIFTFGLHDLEGLNSLTSIGGNLQIKDNKALESVSDLEHLTTIGGSLEIAGNSHNYTGEPKGLGRLIGLDSIDYTTITDLRIYSNQNLSVCGLANICTYLATGGTYEIYDNALNCNSEAEILNTCDGLGQIQLSTFYDINQNKIQDNGEPDYEDAMILIASNTSAFSQIQLSTNTFFGVPDNYAVSYEQGNTDWELTTDSMSYVVSLEENETDTVYFGLYPSDLISNILPTVISSPVRYNEIIPFDISIKNLGTTTASGTLWFELDGNVLATDFVNPPDPPDTTVTPNRYGWFFSDVYPSYTLKKQIYLQILGPPDFPVGGPFSFNTYADFEDENGTNTSPTFNYTPKDSYPYDSNDKLVHPTREGDYALFDEDLIYTIRFQNTGNDVAYDVVILDTLDVNLDRESFRLLGTSHPERLNTSMSPDGILTFEFKNIFLPDSTPNLEGSQGYVSYLIRTIDGLAEETPVTNSAGIYFDLNPPVITNTVQSVMVSELPTVSVQSPDNELDFKIVPNPNTGTFYIQGISKGTYRIFNTVGQIIDSGQLNDSLPIDIPQAASGIYFIEIRSGEQVETQRFIKK